jgi:hypothetical protein
MKEVIYVSIVVIVNKISRDANFEKKSFKKTSLCNFSRTITFWKEHHVSQKSTITLSEENPEYIYKKIIDSQEVYCF